MLRAIDRLPDDYRRVIEARSFDGLSFEEVGARLDRSAEAARRLWVRALDRLRAEMGDHP
jgi:RNA polymerase sigma-70 factor (ECF subfamily)